MKTLPKGRVKRLHVNSHHIRQNKDGDDKPVLICRTSDGPEYSGSGRVQTMEIVHDGIVVCTLEYNADKPLSCGATAWVRTNCEVRIHD